MTSRSSSVLACLQAGLTSRGSSPEVSLRLSATNEQRTDCQLTPLTEEEYAVVSRLVKGVEARRAKSRPEEVRAKAQGIAQARSAGAFCQPVTNGAVGVARRSSHFADVLIRTDPYAELSTRPSFKDDLDVDDIRIFQDRPTYQKRHGDGPDTLRSYTKSIKREATVSKLAEHYKAQGLDRHWFWKYRMAVAEAYANPRTQTIVAGLICANFVAQCFQRQLDPVNQGDPPADHRGQLWATIANFFNVVFLIELLINLYGTWYWPGWLFGSDLSAWNRFDCVIVFLGVVDLCNFPYPGQLKLLRMLRVFRVFRLFNRVESLQKIMHALLEAVPGVLNAGAILFIILFIYSVLAVDLFNRVYYNGKDKRENCDGEGSTHGRTPRHDLCYGWEYYGTFVQASYSLFQIMSGDSWSEMGVRPVLQWFYEKDGKGMDGDVVYKLERLGIMLFFLSFVLLTTFVLMNVVVTILLDKYSSEMSKNAELEAVAQLERMEDHFVRLEQSVNDHLRELTDVINDLASELSRVPSRGLQPTT